MRRVLLDDRFAYRKSISGWERYTQELAKIPASAVFSKYSNYSRQAQNISRLSSEVAGLYELPMLRKKFDLIHFPASPPLIWSDSFAKDSLLSIHDLTWWKFPNLSTRTGRTLYRQAAQKLIKSGCQIVTVTHTMRAEIIDFFNVDSKFVHVIYPGSDFKKFPITLDFCGKPYLLFVGTIEPRKNIGLLIESFLKSKIHANYNLVIAGRIGWDRNLQFPSEVTFIENPTDAELHQLYAYCSAVVNSSIYEGFGLPLIEGLGLGKDLIVPDLPVFREVLSTYPNYFESGNESSLIDCFNEFVPKVDSFSARKYVSERFDWDVFRNNFITLYTEMSV